MLKRPIGVTLISYFYIFGAAVLLFTAVFMDVDTTVLGIADRFGLPNVPERLFRIILAIATLILIFGYMRLRRWGFWLMIVYAMGFGVISYCLLLSQNQQPYMGNLIWSVIVLIYTFYVRKFFTQIA